MKVKDLAAVLAEMNQEADIFISVDVSNDDEATIDYRVYGEEILGWQGNGPIGVRPADCCEVSLQLKGDMNFDFPKASHE